MQWVFFSLLITKQWFKHYNMCINHYNNIKKGDSSCKHELLVSSIRNIKCFFSPEIFCEVSCAYIKVNITEQMKWNKYGVEVCDLLMWKCGFLHLTGCSTGMMLVLSTAKPVLFVVWWHNSKEENVSSFTGR